MAVCEFTKLNQLNLHEHSLHLTRFFFEMLKTFYIKSKLDRNLKALQINGYPNQVKYVGVFCKYFDIDVEYFIKNIRKLYPNLVFTRCFEFDHFAKEKEYYISKKSFDLKGNFKKNYIYEEISKLDLVIDISEQQSLIKNYTISLATQACKISLGHLSDNSQFQLSIKLNNYNLDDFYKELEKYHNILKNG